MNHIKWNDLEWHKLCMNVKNEFLDFMEGFVVAETLLDSHISVMDREFPLGGKYKEFVIHSSAEGIFTITFFILPGSTDINIEIVETPSIVEVEKWKEFKDYDFKILNLIDKCNRFVSMYVDLNEFYKIVAILSKFYHIRNREEK